MPKLTTFFTYLPSDARTGDTDGFELQVPAYDKGYLTVHVTAVSGTAPTLTLKLKTAGWVATIESFPVIIAVGEYFYPFDLPPGAWQIFSAIGGTTPSFTYRLYLQLTGEDTSLAARTVY